LASLVLLDLVLAHPSQALTLDHLMQVPHSLATQGLYVPGLVGDDEFREGFTSGLLLILVSEIGDKTFFVAMLLAVRQSDNSGGNQQSLNSNNNNSNSDGLALKGESSLLDKATERRLVVYVGTVAALGLMTIISCVIGRSFHSLDQMFADYIPSGLSALPLDDLAAVVLLTSFGITSLKDGRALDDKEQQQADDGTRRGSGDVVFDIRDEEDSEEEAAKALVQEMKDEGKISEEQGNGSLLWQSFLLVFAAEWGDRSFLSTIALTAAYPPVAVVAGATSGHAVATALAVGGGSVLAKYISEKAIAYSAGVLFLAFAAATVVDLMV
jgi:putative Ca2+/H+ antiporter (TMEM165/GDT1 family)